MGSYAYILIAAFILAGGVLMMGQKQDVKKADIEVGRIHMKQEARNAASTGFGLTMRKLAWEQGPWLVADSFEVGPAEYGEGGGPTATYQTEVTIVDAVDGDTVDIVATGTKPYTTRRGVGNDTTHVIEARVARGIIQNAIPPAFRYAIIADLELLVHGDFLLDALLDGVNADVHSNGILRANGNSFIIEGMGSYTGGSLLNSQQLDNFDPDDDWNLELDNVFPRDSIPIPVWDSDRFRTAAQTSGYYTTDPLEVDGDALAAAGITTVDQFAETWLGLPPGDYGQTDSTALLVMVDNTLTFDNAVFLDGHIQFGSTDEVDVLTHGSNDGLFMSYTADVDEQIAFTHAGIFTTANVRIEGNATVQASLYADGSITYLGGTHLIGGQVAHETTFQGGGTVQIDWVGIGNGLTEFFDPYDEPVGPVIVSYAEW